MCSKFMSDLVALSYDQARFVGFQMVHEVMCICINCKELILVYISGTEGLKESSTISFQDQRSLIPGGKELQSECGDMQSCF